MKKVIDAEKFLNMLDEAFDELEDELRASIGERLRKAVTPKMKARLNEMGY